MNQNQKDNIIIQAKELSKTYRRFKKKEGIRGSIAGLFKREYEEKAAVSHMDLQVREGEFIGLIGPNGVGKTTLIKMLTGIIVPTSGDLSVLGFTPGERRDAFKKQYAVVMGQKSQLFFELTVNDILRLFQAIYEIPEQEFQENRRYFMELFQVGELMDVQVRTMSLGERMKMELMVALLHNPRVLFLDEPTIGLDAMQQLMVFRLDFFAPFFVDGSLFAVQLLVFGAIYNNVERIGTWDRGAMLVYIGSFSLLNAVSMSLCFFGVISIPGKIRSGELDLYLTKPVSPLFRLSFEQINPGSLPLVGMSLCIIGYGIWTGGLRPGAGQVAMYLLWMLLMAVLYYDMEVLMRSLSFYVLSTSRMDQLEEASLELCMKLPGTALYGVYKLLFYCLLPYGLMATVPVQSLMGELSGAGAAWAFGIVAGFSLLTAAAWRGGIRRYESASS